METAEIAKALGVGRQRAYVISRRRGFPEPLDTLEMGAVWDAEVVERWIRENRPKLLKIQRATTEIDPCRHPTHVASWCVRRERLA
jgi:predicted DNA-binding transcriptional regulator AlpA